ncbi:hypothetical protein AB4K20DRAFT_1909649 [Rhizopus microsporus]
MELFLYFVHICIHVFLYCILLFTITLYYYSLLLLLLLMLILIPCTYNKCITTSLPSFGLLLFAVADY